MPENETPQPFDAATLDDAALAAEYTRIQDRGAELSARTEFADGEADELSELASRADAVQAVQTERAAKAAELSAAREKFAKAPEPAAPAPVVEEAPAVVEPSRVETAAEVAVPSVAEMSNKTPQMPVPKETGKEFSVFVSNDAAGFVGKRAGEEFDGLTEVSDALLRSAAQYGRSGGGSGSRHAIAQFQRTRASEFVVERPEDGMKVLQHARNEARLHGGSLAKQWQHNIDTGAASLTAAAGWCAPSENRYDVCSLWGSNVGLLDLPTIAVRRGGLNYTDEPSFADIYANAIADLNFLTEAEVEDPDTVKTCSEIPCPDFEDRRLDVLALCIRVSFLQAVGYPELVNTWVDGLIEAEAQEMNRLIIADMIARAGAVTTFGVLGGGSDSFTSAMLAAAELAAVDIRYREGMPLNATIEVVYPDWVLAQVRADLSRRTRETPGMLGVTDSQIAALFSARNIRAQFVRGYQDGLITGGAPVPTYPGGDGTPAYMTGLPATVGFLAYPAGSVAVARQDVVTLTNVYDAASNSSNMFTRLFAEEGFAPVYPCPGLRQYSFGGCVGGVVGAAELTCTPPPEPEA